MTPEMLFSICNGIALIGWALLLFLPRIKWVPGLITSVIIPVLLALVYGYLILADLPGAEGGFGSLAEVYLLFGKPWLANPSSLFEQTTIFPPTFDLRSCRACYPNQRVGS
jgi:hypothetical protein